MVDEGLSIAMDHSIVVPTAISKNDYKADLHMLQDELVKLQCHFIKCGVKNLVLLEGRDAAGKYGSIKRIVEHLSPRLRRQENTARAARPGHRVRIHARLPGRRASRALTFGIQKESL